MREKPAILNDITDTATQLGNVRRGDRRVIETDAPGVRIEEPNDESEERRFSASAGANEGGGFSAGEVEIGGVKRDGSAVGFANVGKLNERVHVLFLAKPERRGDAFL